ncbi:MAG: tail fiber domain-containing protein [Verrucomicrobia bacterium]|nr:tail fiber domain-containing protein [Verrucomicrobiota bacterium]
MKTKLHSLLLGLAALAASATQLRAQGTTFTYQGRLEAAGAPYTGLAEMQFRLWDAASGGSQLGSTLTVTPVGVTNGLFTVSLDFGNQFTGAHRWLEIALRTNLLGFTTLSPRQSVTPTPYAITAGNLTGTLAAAQLSGAIPSANFGGTYSGAVTFDNAGNNFTGSGAGLSGLNASQLTTGTVPDARLAANLARTNQVWLLGGNAGTTEGAHFLGTRDGQPLEFRVNGLRVLRLEDNVDGADSGNTPDGAPNVIGGSAANFVGAGVVGATISGGGATNYSTLVLTNVVLADYATVGGGLGNRVEAFSMAATVSGGRDNTIETAADYATIGGGSLNTIQTSANHASIGGGWINTIYSGATWTTLGGGQDNRIWHNASWATIGGGSGNSILTNADYATIGGGSGNRIYTNAAYATIPGGQSNSATNYAFAAGRRAKANHTGSFVWCDSLNQDGASQGNNTFTVRASGGTYFFSSSGNTGVRLAAGDGSWVSLSDRNAKENFEPVDAQEVLDKVAALPLSRWNYKSQEADIRHLGPMAQDFKAAFGLGDSDTGISTVDADGVALAAIQGLNQKLEETRDELKRRDAENAELQQRLSQLEDLVRTLAAHPKGGGR